MIFYPWRYDRVEIEEFKGVIFDEIKAVDNISYDGYEYELLFKTEDGITYSMHHEQDCCESVYLEEVIGELNDLIGSPILLAEEVCEESDTEWGTQTWTFYKLATVYGSVTLRWLGQSNGYYSEKVSIVKLP